MRTTLARVYVAVLPMDRASMSHQVLKTTEHGATHTTTVPLRRRVVLQSLVLSQKHRFRELVAAEPTEIATVRLPAEVLRLQVHLHVVLVSEQSTAPRTRVVHLHVVLVVRAHVFSEAGVAAIHLAAGRARVLGEVRLLVAHIVGVEHERLAAVEAAVVAAGVYLDDVLLERRRAAEDCLAHAALLRLIIVRRRLVVQSGGRREGGGRGVTSRPRGVHVAWFRLRVAAVEQLREHVGERRHVGQHLLNRLVGRCVA